jgi:hypothetical protein
MTQPSPSSSSNEIISKVKGKKLVPQNGAKINSSYWEYYYVYADPGKNTVKCGICKVYHREVSTANGTSGLQCDLKTHEKKSEEMKQQVQEKPAMKKKESFIEQLVEFCCSYWAN